jgi:NAD(P)-dependent dehydrogenase (short-subunit alcohol dehydrogenase family)
MGAEVTRLKLWLGAALALLAAFWGAWIAGRREGAQAARVDALEGDAKAHERMNDADFGLDLSDADRVRRLHEFADKHSR